MQVIWMAGQFPSVGPNYTSASFNLTVLYLAKQHFIHEMNSTASELLRHNFNMKGYSQHRDTKQHQYGLCMSPTVLH